MAEKTKAFEAKTNELEEELAAARGHTLASLTSLDQASGDVDRLTSEVAVLKQELLSSQTNSDAVTADLRKEVLTAAALRNELDTLTQRSLEDSQIIKKAEDAAAELSRNRDALQTAKEKLLSDAALMRNDLKVLKHIHTHRSYSPISFKVYFIFSYPLCSFHYCLKVSQGECDGLKQQAAVDARTIAVLQGDASDLASTHRDLTVAREEIEGFKVQAMMDARALEAIVHQTVAAGQEIEALRAQQCSLREQLAEKERVVDNMIRQSKSAESEFRQAEERIDDLTKQMSIDQQQIVDLRGEVKRLSEKVNDVEFFVSLESQRADDALEKVAFWSKEATEIAAAFEKELAEKTKAFEAKTNELEEELAAARGHTLASLTSLDQASGDVDRLTRENAVLKQELLSSQTNGDAVTTELAVFQRDFSSAQSQLKVLADENSILRNEAQQRSDQANAECAQLRSALEQGE